MFKHIFLENQYAQLLGILSVCVFLFIFLFRFFLSLCLSKQHINKMSSLPLQDDKDIR
jgi:hypothetical protein